MEQSTDRRADQGKMAVVCSASGGTGRTILTANLAVYLASQNQKVTVVDGDLQFGDLALALDIEPYSTILDAAKPVQKDRLQNFCIKHEKGFHVLAAPPRPELADLIDERQLSTIGASLKQDNDLVVVEAAAGLNDRSLAFIEQADDIFIVTTNGMAPLKNTSLMVEALQALGLKDKCSVVVNRATVKGKLAGQDFSDLFAVNELFYMPDDSSRVVTAMDTGRPFVIDHPKAEISKRIKLIGKTLLPAAQERSSASSRTFLHRLLRKTKAKPGDDK
ncbi:AAA family ATPase [Marinococcus luteus]|uniref:AAA family ATPase n=1 Tax=Marinococcus luteus TaxID=1122204 RepID=UPI002ACC59AF|nr:P-loop NTPase [Marinococcus luteus]MDZ5783468.1 P-loop NTPase [Marinococcus luteus]